VSTSNLSSMGDHHSSNAAGSIAIRIIWSHKPQPHVKTGIT
jgi:hypothetical protein